MKDRERGARNIEGDAVIGRRKKGGG